MGQYRQAMFFSLGACACLGMAWLLEGLDGPVTLLLGAMISLCAGVAGWLGGPSDIPEAVTISPPVSDSGADDLPRSLGIAMLSRIADPIVVLDWQGRIKRANPAAGDLLGENLVDRPLAAYLRAPAVLDAIDKVAETGDLKVVEVTLRVPVERHLQVQIARVEQMGGRRPGTVLLFHDMTQVKRAERLRADFVANASHELKTPLTVLSGFIETLEGPAKDDPAARTRFLTIMREQAARMARLVNDLLSLSRIELNEHLSPRDAIDLGALIRDVADGLSLMASAHKSTIEVRLPASYPAVYGEREELVQAFQNLLDNAIKYGRGDKPIEVSLYGTGIGGNQRLAISVRDYGEGIPKDHIPRLTERFYRVDAVRSRERGGTGLGLAIVKHIVNRHRGQLTIDSIVGEGSLFTISLPVIADTSLTAPRAMTAPGEAVVIKLS
jgi:two-component system phosphate regulon sensor histidine kinase PhoR